MSHINRRRAAALAIAVSGAALAAGCGATAAKTTAQGTTASSTVPTVSTTPTTSTFDTTPTFGTTPTVGTDTTSTFGTTPTVGTDTGSDTVGPGGTVDVATFVSDLQDFAQTLTQFGLTLQAAAEGPAALRARSATMRSQLDRFDQITAKMAGYHVDMPSLDKRRAAIVAASPDVSRLGRELLDAAEANDAPRIQRVAQEFIKAIERLRDAAQG